MSFGSRIFGSPPEPIFNEKKNGISSQLLDDSFKLLVTKNEAAVSANPSFQERVSNKNIVLFLFELCSALGLRPEIQYWAVELFQRFLVNHVAELRQHVEASQKTESPIRWNDVETRLKHQSVLRAVSCVQLASKLSTHYNILSINRAKNFLSSCGFRYTTTSIVQSEVRVLKTLDFKVHRPSPLEFIEALLGYLGRESEVVPVKQLHGLSLKVLDVFYISSENVYDKLKLDCDLKGKTAAAVEADLMLLAASVIGAAAFILGQSHSELVITCVSKLTCIVPEDIMKFATVLLEEILSDSQ